MPAEVIGEPDTLKKAGTVIATEVTVPIPAPDGVFHVPSPHQKVTELAPVPLLRFVTGRFPDTCVAKLMSAGTKARNVGEAAAPVVGPASIVLAL